MSRADDLRRALGDHPAVRFTDIELERLMAACASVSMRPMGFDPSSPISATEKRALAFIRRAKSPSFRDLADHLGFRSVRSASVLAGKLRARGLLEPTGPLKIKA